MNDSHAEVLFVAAYFVAYMAYLFARLEGELAHWLGLVLVPLTLLWLLRRRRGQRRLRALLASIGLEREGLWRAVVIGLIAGIALGSLQLLLSRRREEALLLVQSGAALYLYPAAVGLMLLTAATTEEVFFRGILQTRLIATTRSRIAGVFISALAFGLYHLPYAYLNPRWPSHGDWGDAFRAAFGQGTVMGVILGGLMIFARGHLVAPILAHACFNAGWAMTLLKR